MGYYIRVLSTSDNCPSLSQLRQALANEKLNAIINSDDEDGDWESFVLSHPEGGTDIAAVERNPVVEGELGQEELDEFKENLNDIEPRNAAEWVKAYLNNVRTIYAFQLLSGTDVDQGWDKLYAVRNAIKSYAPSISQADREGFANEEDVQITWEFSDDVSALWNMAVLKDGSWVAFEMDLANQAQRKDFKEGKIPSGAKPLK